MGNQDAKDIEPPKTIVGNSVIEEIPPVNQETQRTKAIPVIYPLPRNPPTTEVNIDFSRQNHGELEKIFDYSVLTSEERQAAYGTPIPPEILMPSPPNPLESISSESKTLGSGSSDLNPPKAN